MDEEPRVAAALGQYQEQAGLLREAAATYTKALAVQPMSRELKSRRITALYNAKDYKAAAAFATDARRQHPEDARFPRLQGRALFDAGDRAGGVAVLEEAAKAFPKDTPTLYALADIYRDADRGTDAEKALRQVLVLEPTNPNALNYLGYLLAMRGDKLDEAVQLVRKALEAEPDNGAYLDSLGWAHFKRGDLAEAEKYLGAAAQRMPTQLRGPGPPGRRVRAPWARGRRDRRLEQGARRRRRGRRSRGRPPEDRRRAHQSVADRPPAIASRACAPCGGRVLAEARSRRLLAAAALALLSAACAARRIALPQDAGTPMADAAAVHARCPRRAGASRPSPPNWRSRAAWATSGLRGRVIAGFDRPARCAWRAWRRSVLRLSCWPRVRGRPCCCCPATSACCAIPSARDVLGALSGVPLAPADLLAVLTGCVVPDPTPAAGRLHERGWASIDLGGAATAVPAAGQRRLAGARGAPRAMGDRVRPMAGRPSPAGPAARSEGQAPVDATWRCRQIETNVTCRATAFTVEVPSEHGRVDARGASPGRPAAGQ